MDCIGLIPSFHGDPYLNNIYMHLKPVSHKALFETPTDPILSLFKLPDSKIA